MNKTSAQARANAVGFEILRDQLDKFFIRRFGSYQINGRFENEEQAADAAEASKAADQSIGVGQ